MVTGNFFPAKAAGQKSNLGYSPIVARTGSTHRTSELAAFDCIRVIVIRDGSAFLDGEFGTESVTVGHIVVLGADVYCRTEPEGHVTSTVIYIDPDYLADQMFWQYSHVLQDRLDAKELFATLYAEKSQVLKLGEERVGMFMPWLDEMTMLSAEDSSREHFLRIQALWFSVADAITPYIRVSSTPLSPNQQAQSRPTLPRGRKYTPIRDEALTIHTALQDDLTKEWKLSEMAAMVHLSTKQLSRVFSTAFGKTPQAYLTILRVEEMARLLRETDTTIAEAGRNVGWRSRSRAVEAFRECTGRTPQEYRRMRMVAGARLEESAG